MCFPICYCIANVPSWVSDGRLMLCCTIMLSTRPWLPRSSGTSAMPASIASLGASSLMAGTVYANLAARRRVKAKECPQQFGTPRTHQASQPHNFATIEAERYFAVRPRHGRKACHLHHADHPGVLSCANGSR